MTAHEFISGIAIIVNGTREERAKFQVCRIRYGSSEKIVEATTGIHQKHLSRSDDDVDKKKIYKTIDRVEENYNFRVNILSICETISERTLLRGVDIRVR